MKGRKALGSFGALAALTLLVAVLFNGADYQWILFLAVFGAWAGFLLLRRRLRRAVASRRHGPARKNRKKGPRGPAAESLLLGHLNWRITEKLQSVYPEAAWQWQTADPVRIASGGIARILLYGAGGHTHADVAVDGYGRIALDLLEVTPLRTLPGNPPPCPVNPAEWFDRHGRHALTALINELNPRGYTRMYLRENGEVFTLRGGNEFVEETLQHMPGKALWQELCAVITRMGLSAEEESDRIAISWA